MHINDCGQWFIISQGLVRYDGLNW
jgi:hypothetical protein